jgi:two-component system sensor histidine kinase and response regulator WspE
VTAKPTCDAALLELFRAELDTHLPVLGEGLLALEKGDTEPSRLEGLMRAAHSIKGAARIVGLDEAVQLAHVLEDAFVAAQRGEVRLGSDAVDVLLRGVDALQRIGTSQEDAPDEAAFRELLDDVAAVRRGKHAPVGQDSDPASCPRQVWKPAPHPVGRASDPASSQAARIGILPHGVVRPAGDLVAAEAEVVRSRLAELLRGGAPEVVLDFAAVGDVDAAGLALLAAAARRAPASFRIVNAAAPVRELLRLTRLDACLRPGGGEG